MSQASLPSNPLHTHSKFIFLKLSLDFWSRWCVILPERRPFSLLSLSQNSKDIIQENMQTHTHLHKHVSPQGVKKNRTKIQGCEQ